MKWISWSGREVKNEMDIMKWKGSKEWNGHHEVEGKCITKWKRKNKNERVSDEEKELGEVMTEIEGGVMTKIGGKVMNKVGVKWRGKIEINSNKNKIEMKKSETRMNNKIENKVNVVE